MYICTQCTCFQCFKWTQLNYVIVSTHQTALLTLHSFSLVYSLQLHSMYGFVYSIATLVILLYACQLAIVNANLLTASSLLNGKCFSIFSHMENTWFKQKGQHGKDRKNLSGRISLEGSLWKDLSGRINFYSCGYTHICTYTTTSKLVAFLQLTVWLELIAPTIGNTQV